MTTATIDFDDEVFERALTRFDTVALPQQPQRAESLQARRFVTIPGAQWEGDWGVQFENAPRPEVDKITKSLEKIETDYRENRLTVAFKPANDIADEDTAETLNGMYRADAYEYKAQQAKDNAFQEAIRGGFGAYRLCTVDDDEYDPDNDKQRVNPGMVITDADQSVYFDGASKLYDKSDAKWAFIVTANPRIAAEEEWGEANCVEWPVAQWKWQYDWYTPDVVRIAEYYEVEVRSENRLTLTNDLTSEEQRYWEDEVDAQEITDLQAQGWVLKSKKAKRRRVHKFILNGTKILKDCGFIAGDCIPIVPVYYRREYVDNMERWRGFVGKKMDRQRIYNSQMAKLVETSALAPYEVPMLTAEQVSGYVSGPDGTLITIAEHWARGNIDRTPFRIVNPLIDPDGSYAQLGPVGKVEPPQVQPATAALLQISSADLTDEDQNVEEVKANVSADAMDIAQSRVDAKSGIALDNMRQSEQRGAEIYLGMAREVNFEPEREVETRTHDGEDGTAKLYEPMIDQNSVYRIRNDLSRGKYKVVADVQESTSTARQKTVRQNMTIAEVAGQLGNQALGNAALLTAVMNQDGEGQQDMQAYARNQLIALGVIKPTPEEQQEIAKAQQEQGQQPPSPADQALQAQAAELASKAELNKAKSVETLASAHLKGAQAEAVGGPASEPEKPSGLTDVVDAHERMASAGLKIAQADNLRHGMTLDKIRTVADLHKVQHEIEMGRRAQDHAEKQPKAA